MDWNWEVDRAIISDVPMEEILQIKREHIIEPIKRSIELYGNKPNRLALILEYGDYRTGTTDIKGA